MILKYKNKSELLISTELRILILIIFFSSGILLIGQNKNKETIDTFKSIPIAFVPASFPVSFSLYTFNNKQFVAFYDSTHQLNIAARNLNDSTWDFHKLDSRVGWDSHNYLSMVIDNEGYIHLAGNMHSSPLIYFRSTIPLDIHSMHSINLMTGNDEDVTTYPEFMRVQNNELVFHYRYGRSGSGYEVLNKWNPASKTWSRLLNKPLTDGHGKMNAYIQGPTPGPDGYYHLIWVWRDSPDCATNHTLSYARSRNLLDWESVRGENVELPLTIDYKNLYVDATPIHGGLINIGIRIGFDSKGNILIGYHKYDSSGNTQLFIARYGNNEWTTKQVTNWNYLWDFKGYGTIVNELLIESPKPSSQKGKVVFGFHHVRYGDGEIVIDEASLEPLHSQPIERNYSQMIDNIHSAIPGMLVNKVFDSGKTNDGKKYLLRWETLAPNRDQKRESVLPPNSLLEIIAY